MNANRAVLDCLYETLEKLGISCFSDGRVITCMEYDREVNIFINSGDFVAVKTSRNIGAVISEVTRIPMCDAGSIQLTITSIKDWLRV